jgi:recombinational DNA repair protein RecT
MAQKTMLLQLVKYMPMTIEMSQAMAADHSDRRISVDQEIEQDYIDISGDDQESGHVPDAGEMTEEEKAEIAEQEAAEAAEAPY